MVAVKLYRITPYFYQYLTFPLSSQIETWHSGAGERDESHEKVRRKYKEPFFEIEKVKVHHIYR